MLDQRREQFVFRFSGLERDSLCLLDGYDDSSLYPPTLRRVFSSRRRRPLLPVFLRKPAESMTIAVTFPRAGIGIDRLERRTVVYRISARMSIAVSVGKRCATLRGRTRTHVQMHACTHARAYTYAYARTQPKDSKRQMLKRPMETGHVDVAADVPHRAASRRTATPNCYENIPPLSRRSLQFFFDLSTANRSAPYDLNLYPGVITK